MIYSCRKILMVKRLPAHYARRYVCYTNIAIYDQFVIATTRRQKETTKQYKFSHVICFWIIHCLVFICKVFNNSTRVCINRREQFICFFPFYLALSATLHQLFNKKNISCSWVTKLQSNCNWIGYKLFNLTLNLYMNNKFIR